MLWYLGFWVSTTASAAASVRERRSVVWRDLQGRRLRVQAAAQAAAHEVEQKRRVVVTGLGVVSALGLEVDTFYNALLDGRSGVSRIEVRDFAQRAKPSTSSKHEGGERKVRVKVVCSMYFEGWEATVRAKLRALWHGGCAPIMDLMIPQPTRLL